MLASVWFENEFLVHLNLCFDFLHVSSMLGFYASLDKSLTFTQISFLGKGENLSLMYWSRASDPRAADCSHVVILVTFNTVIIICIIIFIIIAIIIVITIIVMRTDATSTSQMEQGPIY